mmetsp:Transcript_68464/g.164400  ORF Transcript_68464/g.164400 Transcript_68464/m.164400 type:complete len:384 (-) Transcript_68464:8-1159(-)
MAGLAGASAASILLKSGAVLSNTLKMHVRPASASLSGSVPPAHAGLASPKAAAAAQRGLRRSSRRLAATVSACAFVAALAARRRTPVTASGVPERPHTVVMQARGGAAAADLAPAVIIGGGRVGEALAAMGGGSDIVVRRGESFPANAPAGPIFVCTRNDDLKAIIEMTPKERREDLVFIQNGALLPFLEKELGKETPFTVLLVYFAVAKKGDPPLDGKTDTDPDGLSAVDAGGKWADAVAARLHSGDLSCRQLPGAEFSKAYWEKNMWIAAYMLVGALHGGCTVGEVESEHRAEVDAIITELAGAVAAATPGVAWDDVPLLCDRLAAYARSVAHFPTAVKEFQWRNGAFYDLSTEAMSKGAPDPCPKHTAGLQSVGAVAALA